MKKVKKVFRDEFNFLKAAVKQFLPEGPERDLALLHLEMALVHATEAANQIADEDGS